LKFKFIQALEAFLLSEKGAQVSITPEVCPSHTKGDLTVNCFRFAKSIKGNPMQLAQEITDWLNNHEDVESAECIKAFINITLTNTALFQDTLNNGKIIDQCLLPKEERQRILIEFSAPNTNKPQHLGHVRNNVLGQSTCSILKRAGHDVVAVNLINDRGIHICKSMIAYQRFGNNITPEEFGKKGDHLVGHFYVLYNTELKKQISELRESKPEFAEKSDNDLFLETEIGQATQEMLIKWEEDDQEVRALWEKMNNWVFAGFDVTYNRLGVKFDKVYLESNTYLSVKDIVEKGFADGVFYKREDGAIEIDLEEVKCGKKVVLRSDGTSVYITQDIGTTILKHNDIQPDGQIWVVGDEQKYHFKVLFEILKRLGYSWAENLHHMAYGMVNLPTGKMKSREGTVVDADDLLDEMQRLATLATVERCGANIPEDLEKRAAIVGTGALKFMLLKVNPKTTLMFDPNESVKFEGDTGPYVQYAYARICSILRKAEKTEYEKVINWNVLGEESEKELALTCARYPEIIRNAATGRDSSVIAGYLLNLAKAFSRFYTHCPVLSAPESEKIAPRIELCKITAEILKDGLNTLTIDTLESM
jgi:arginyl-tRNA synthetase